MVCRIQITGAEIMNGAGLMLAGQTAGIVLASGRIVGGDVLRVAFGQFLNGLIDCRDAAVLTRCLGRYIGVGTGTVPVTGNWFRVQSGNNLFGKKKKKKSNIKIETTFQWHSAMHG